MGRTALTRLSRSRDFDATLIDKDSFHRDRLVLRAVVRLLFRSLAARTANRIMTATTDLASLAQEIGGDKVDVDPSLAAIKTRTLSIRSRVFFSSSPSRSCSSSLASNSRSAGCRRSSHSQQSEDPGRRAGYLDASGSRKSGNSYRPSHPRRRRRSSSREPALLVDR